MNEITSIPLKKTRYCFPKQKVCDPASFDFREKEDSFITYKNEEINMDKEEDIKEDSSFLTYKEEPEEKLTFIGENASEENILTLEEQKENKGLLKKQKAVEKVRKSSEKKYEEIAGEKQSKEKNTHFSLFEAGTETKEEKEKRILYEKINADGYYNEIKPIDFQEEDSEGRKKCAVPKEKLVILGIVAVLLVFVVAGLMYLFR